MLAFVIAHSVWFIAGGALVVFVLILWLGVRVIPEGASGLVVKRFGPSLPAGRIVAVDGEAGHQARLLSPGWHFGLWRWQYKVQVVPPVVVRPGEIGLVVAADGDAIPQGRILGAQVECDSFQDADAFLRRGGERGRQLGLLTAGTYRINPALFKVLTPSSPAGYPASELRVREIAPDMVGVVTVLDGRPIPAGDLAGAPVQAHDSFQNGQAFLAAGGCRGLQEEVLLSGAWNLNPWFAQVEVVPMTEIPIGYVGVVVSYVGREHVDVSGDGFMHGDLVERGRKGVWVEPLLPGKHPVNPRIMRIELVPTTNIVLNWATRNEAHGYDQRLSPITVRSKDGFGFSLDVSQIVHIGAKNAPRVISRVGSMQNLVDHVMQPTVANYFRNSAQEVSVLEFLSARSTRQRQAYDSVAQAIRAYDVECIDTLIGDIVPPAELMKTQTDRKIAEELQRTYEVQREAQRQRQDLERETAVANLQGEVVRSEQSVHIAERQALASAEGAKGRAAVIRLTAEAEASSTRMAGDAEAESTRAVGLAKAAAYREGIAALGEGYTALQLATVLAQHHVRLVPDVASGTGAGGIAEALVARMLVGGRVAESGPARTA